MKKDDTTTFTKSSKKRKRENGENENSKKIRRKETVKTLDQYLNEAQNNNILTQAFVNLKELFDKILCSNQEDREKILAGKLENLKNSKDSEDKLEKYIKNINTINTVCNTINDTYSTSIDKMENLPVALHSRRLKTSYRLLKFLQDNYQGDFDETQAFQLINACFNIKRWKACLNTTNFGKLKFYCRKLFELSVFNFDLTQKQNNLNSYMSNQKKDFNVAFKYIDIIFDDLSDELPIMEKIKNSNSQNDVVGYISIIDRVICCLRNSYNDLIAENCEFPSDLSEILHKIVYWILTKYGLLDNNHEENLRKVKIISACYDFRSQSEQDPQNNCLCKLYKKISNIQFNTSNRDVTAVAVPAMFVLPNQTRVEAKNKMDMLFIASFLVS